MTFVLTNTAESYAQLLTVLIIFVVVLGATALTTKWIAGYQKKQGISGNMELLDAVRLGNSKYIQLVRIGEKYVAIAVCKDTVTVLAEIPEDQLRRENRREQSLSFRDIFDRIRRSDDKSAEPRTEESKDKEE